jgi:hypothetical protein
MNELSTPDRRRVGLAEAIAAAWGERGLEYAVVHGLERYPGSIGRDLDVVLHRHTVRDAVKTAVERGSAHGFRTVLFRWSHWGLYQLALLDTQRSTSLALDLLCTTGVWRAKYVRMLDEALLTRLVAGDERLGVFTVSNEGRFLKSCVRPLLCRDLSRFGEGREWSLPVDIPPDVDLGIARSLLGGSGLEALASRSARELHEGILDGARGLQRRWIRSHPLGAIHSVADATRGRILRAALNPAAVLCVAAPSPEIAVEAARDLVEEARSMFVELRPAAKPRSPLARIRDEAMVWRAPPVSEFAVAVVVGELPDRRRRAFHRRRHFLPWASLALPAGLGREGVRVVLREHVLDFLAATYSVDEFLGDRRQARGPLRPGRAVVARGARAR